MSSTTSSRPTGEGSPAPVAFSYAQAAKGRASATAASAIQSHQANASGTSTPAKDTSSMIHTPSGGSEKGDRSVSGSQDAMSKVYSAGDTSSSDAKGSISGNLVSSSASPSIGTASTSTLPKDEKGDDFTLVGNSSDRERGSHGATAGPEKPTEQTESRKGKKSKKSKNADKETEKEKEKEKEKEEVKPELLVPAPLPTVNFWQQRSVELARVKPSTPTAGPEPSSLKDVTVSSAKSSDAKKRGKPSNHEEDKHIPAAQDGGAKGLSAVKKGQKNSGDGANKLKKDQITERSAARGSRAAEKEEKPITNQLPPPVEDATLWPTPETALEEEKRKAQEKGDKEDKDEIASNKPRTKEKWVPVPYVPTVNFNTPMPSIGRGGRGRGGLRGGRAEGGGRLGNVTNGVATGDKSVESEKHIANGPRSSSLPPTKRQPNDQSGRKSAAAQPLETTKSGLPNGETGAAVESRQAAQGSSEGNNLEQPLFHGDISKASKFEQSQGAFYDQVRPGLDRKSEQNIRAAEPYRADVRADRGRGGFRGRQTTFANAQSHPPNSFSNGAQQPNGYAASRQNSGPYSPTLQQPFSHQYTPTSRGGRNNGPRAHSISNGNGAMYSGRYNHNGGSMSQHMAPLQTTNSMYDYPHNAQPAGTVPYNAYIEQVPSVHYVVIMQLEYYFSVENLIKDVFLRRHMDSQGFVFLTVIAGFKRINALTQDFEALQHAASESDVVELVKGEDGRDRLRRKTDWEQWVLSMSERDASAQTAGPAHFQHFPRKSSMGPVAVQGHQTMSPLPFSPNGNEPHYNSYGNGVPAPPTMNGNGVYHPETSLSAAVPDFAPGVPPRNVSLDPLVAETTFNDEEIENLTVVFASPKGLNPWKSKLPYHNASSRTFSNGSIDGRSIAEELQDENRQGRALTNGSKVSESSPDELRRSRSPFTPLSPTKSTVSNSPPVMWVKGPKQQQALVSEQHSLELYTSFRDRALEQRKGSSAGETHDDMKLLYEFWSHFLCRNFNSTMYGQFRSYALQDTHTKSMCGMKNLISYYDEVLNSKKKVISEHLARDYVDLVKVEPVGGDRPALERLRSAWRNGALDFRSRKVLVSLVDPELKDELDRAPNQKND